MKSLGGATFIRNGIQFDYNWKETISCLVELCDSVVVVNAGSDDGTAEELDRMLYGNPDWSNVMVIHCSKADWDAQHGREKLSYFSNIAIAALKTDFSFYLQADECLHEDCFKYVREAIELDKEGFMCARFNLWNSPKTMLNVPEDRQPCSSAVVRLAKNKYRCVGDAESIGVDKVDMTFLFRIQIWHLGFVRKRDAMKKKVYEMQQNIFEIDYDRRIDEDEVFQPMKYFKPEDLIEIHTPLPKFIQEWAKEREV